MNFNCQCDIDKAPSEMRSSRQKMLAGMIWFLFSVMQYYLIYNIL